MEGIANPWMWTGFAIFVVLAIAVDLFALERKGSQTVTLREALNWSLLWVTLALIFSALLWLWLAHTQDRTIATLKTIEFLTGYLIEKSLSVDNIFVFLMLFTALAVPPQLQKRALIIGVIGAVILRAIMILIGAWLIARFHWILYFFGLFLLITGGKMIWMADHNPDLESNPILRWMRQYLTITPNFIGEKLWETRQGKYHFTPLFVVIILIGITDIIFAVDSIPAIFAITTDPFIVMSSNIFAILGLRALYFLLAKLATRFHLLKYGLAVVLIFIGIKMLIVDIFKIPAFISLGIIVSILLTSVTASWIIPDKKSS